MPTGESDESSLCECMDRIRISHPMPGINRNLLNPFIGEYISGAEVYVGEFDGVTCVQVSYDPGGRLPNKDACRRL